MSKPTKKEQPQQPALPPLGPPHYRGPAGIVDNATCALVARLEAIRQAMKAKEQGDA